MISAWNQLNAHDTILTEEMSADDLWDILYKKLNVTNERDWLENVEFMNKVESICPALANTMRYLAFRPLFNDQFDPRLSQKDINHCVVQLLYSFRKTVSSDLNFLGAQAVDYFSEQTHDTLIPYSTDWGIVLNTVTRSEGGEHWVAIFHAKRTSTLEYFDCSGEPPSRRLCNVLKLLKAKNKYIKEIITSTKSHQEDEYNCGVYALLFLFLRYISISFNTIEAEKITYNHIRQFRDLLFDHA